MGLRFIAYSDMLTKGFIDSRYVLSICIVDSSQFLITFTKQRTMIVKLWAKEGRQSTIQCSHR